MSGSLSADRPPAATCAQGFARFGTGMAI